MKGKPNTDEMLNAYVDGELNTRQKTEVKRLLDREESLATQAERLRRSRQLIASLPREEAPADIADEVLAILERKTLLGERKVAVAADISLRGRMFRRVKAIAAVLVLFLALGGLIYSIMAPPPDNNGVVAQDGPFIFEPISPDVQLAAVLSMTGGIDVESRLNDGLRACKLPLLGASEGSEPTRRAEIQCSRAAFNRLVERCEGFWPADASLQVYAVAGSTTMPTEIPGITTAQLKELAAYTDSDDADAFVQRMSVSNSLNPHGLWPDAGVNTESFSPSLPDNVILASGETLKSESADQVEEETVHLVLIFHEL